MMRQLEQVQEEVRSSFNHLASSYADSYSDRSRIGHFFTSRKRRVEEWLRDPMTGSNVLEVGCGPGLMVDYFLQKGADYCGVDLSPEMIATCKARFNGQGKARFAAGDIQHLDFLPDSTFDLALCLGVLEYVPSEPQAVRELARVLKPGGTLILSAITKWSPFNAWERLVYRRLTGRGSGPIVQEYHTEEFYHGLVPACGFEILDTLYFDFSLVIHPLDYKFPNFSWELSERLEGGCRSAWRRLGNGFLIKCRRS